jgi:hypothetical protein
MGHERVDSGIFDLYQDVPTANAATNLHSRDVVGNKSDTSAGTSLVSIGKGIKAVVDANALLLADIKIYTALSEVVSSTDYTDVGGEQTIYEMATATRRLIHGVWIDLVNMTKDGTIKFYYKIDGTNYREIKAYTFTAATDSDGVYIALNFGVTNNWKVTYTEGADEAAIRAIPYSVIYEVRE